MFAFLMGLSQVGVAVKHPTWYGSAMQRLTSYPHELLHAAGPGPAGMSALYHAQLMQVLQQDPALLDGAAQPPQPCAYFDPQSCPVVHKQAYAVELFTTASAPSGESCRCAPSYTGSAAVESSQPLTLDDYEQEQRFGTQRVLH